MQNTVMEEGKKHMLHFYIPSTKQNLKFAWLLCFTLSLLMTLGLHRSSNNANELADYVYTKVELRVGV